MDLAIYDISAARGSVASLHETLEALEARSSASSGMSGDTSSSASSAFLEGETVTLAGAALLQQATAAVTRVGGNVLSSQVELEASKSNGGLVKIAINCDIEQPAIQKMLFSLETGVPYLFVDQLVVQAPSGSAKGSTEKLHVLLNISGQWRGAE